MRVTAKPLVLQSLLNSVKQASNVLHNGVVRERHAWDGIQITKAERKGKTPDEIQALRKLRWEELNRS